VDEDETALLLDAAGHVIRLGHDDRGPDVEAARDVGHGLGMVARRGGDDAHGALGVGQGQQSVEGAALLEGARHLQVFEFQVEGRVYLAAEGFGAG